MSRPDPLEVTGEFEIRNNGDAESLLSWEIAEAPEWGEWAFTPYEGIDLTPEMGKIKVTVFCTAPENPEVLFDGHIKIVNTEDPSDYEMIEATLFTSKSKTVNYDFSNFFDNYFRLFQFIKFIIQQR